MDNEQIKEYIVDFQKKEIPRYCEIQRPRHPRHPRALHQMGTIFAILEFFNLSSYRIGEWNS